MAARNRQHLPPVVSEHFLSGLQVKPPVTVSPVDSFQHLISPSGEDPESHDVIGLLRATARRHEGEVPWFYRSLRGRENAQSATFVKD